MFIEGCAQLVQWERRLEGVERGAAEAEIAGVVGATPEQLMPVLPQGRPRGTPRTRNPSGCFKAGEENTNLRRASEMF